MNAEDQTLNKVLEMGEALNEGMLTLTMTKGLPGSGKTTWALEELRQRPGATKRVNKDELRGMLDGGHHSKGNEAFLLGVRDHIVRTALLEGKHVIVDDTNLHPKHEEALRAIATEVSKKKGTCLFEVKSFLHVPLEVCIANDLKRVNSVGEAVIRRMHNEHLRPERPIAGQVPHNPELPDCVIVDIDGTLARMNGRGPFEWSRVHEDLPNNDILYLVRQLGAHHTIILCSGRDAVCRQQTLNWLAQHNVPFTHLHMRPEGNREKDSEIKERIYREHIQGRFNVHFVLDDRDQVVRLWRDLGLRCLQVADGKF